MVATRLVIACLPDNLEVGRQILQGICTYRSPEGRWRVLVSAANFLPVLDWSATAGVIGFFADAATLTSVPWQRVPTINTSARERTLPVPSVYSDNLAIGQLAAAHLRDLGLRSFAGYGFGEAGFALDRLAGFQQVVLAAGGVVQRIEHHRLSDFLRKADKPIGVFAVNDSEAAKVINACTDLGLSVPNQVAVIGVDCDSLANTLSGVPISSVDPNGIQIGYTAAQQLDRLLHGQDVPHVTLVPPIGVKVRDSSDMVAICDEVVAQTVRYIHDHAMGPLKVGDLCREISISRRTLEKRFRQRLGRSLHAQIVQTRLDHAKNLLASTDLPVYEIASRSGFRYLSRFMMLFKQHVGVSPGAFRKRFELR